MHKRLFLVFGLAVAAGTILINVSSAVPALQNQENAKSSPKTTDEDDSPIVDFQQAASSGAVENAKRRSRGAKHDKSLWNIDPSDVSENTVLVDFVDPNLPALPFAKSSVVLLGSVTAAKAYLSNDRTGIYSEFSLSIEQVIKSDFQASLAPGCTVEAGREGGRIKFATGHVHLYKVSELEMPRVGRRYVFFLSGEGQDQGFQILTAYELTAGKIIPLDKLRQQENYRNLDETVFLNEIRKMAAGN